MKRWIPHILTVLALVLFGAQHALASVSTDSMVLYWKFDEGTGTVAGDSSGHNFTGSLLGGISGTGWVTNTPDSSFTNSFALEFNGSGDYVSRLSNDSDLTFGTTDSLSVCLWMYPHDVSSSLRTAISKGSTDGDNKYNYQIRIVNGQLDYLWRSSTPAVADNVLRTTSSISTNSWIHVCAVHISGTSATIYLNGTAASASYADGAVTNLLHPWGETDKYLDVGREANRRFFDGLIDDVRIYNRALTGSEITSLASGEYTTAKWDGSSSTNWETAANWDISAVPDPWTNIIIPDLGGTNRDPQLAASVSGASLTIEASATLDLHGYNMELTGSGGLSGGGTLKLRNSETLERFSNIHTSSTGTVLYYGTGTYTTLKAGYNYHNLSINDGLVGYWKFDEGTGTSAYDSSGHNHTSTLISGAAFSSDIPSLKYTNSYSLDLTGSTDSAVVQGMDAASTAPVKNVTVSAWVKPTASTSGLAVSDNPQITYGIYYQSGYFSLALKTWNNGFLSTPSTTSSPPYSWYHVLQVYNGASVKLYVDNVLHVEEPATGTLRYDFAGYYELTFGAYSGGVSTNFVGLLDDVRVYNRALSTTEISRLASGAQPQTASGTYTLGAALNVDGDLTLAAGNLNTSPSAYRITVSGSWLNYGGTFTAQSGSVVMAGKGTVNTIQAGGQSFNKLSISDELIGYWKLDETSGSVAYDSSGYGADATYGNNPTVITSSLPSLSFKNIAAIELSDGADNVINNGDDDKLVLSQEGSSLYKFPAGQDFSVGTWIKTTDAQYYQFIVSNETCCSIRTGFELALNITSGNPYFSAYSSCCTSAAGTTPVNDDVWHYLTGVREGNTLKIYVDGTLEGTTSLTSASLLNAGLLGLGGTGQNSFFNYRGQFDDIRIYNRALSSAEIAALAAGDVPDFSIATYTLGSSLDVTGGLTLASGTLDASSNNYRISASGGWMNYGGVFTARSGTVVLDGIRDTVQSNGSSFYNLTVSGGLIGYWTFDEGTGTTTKDLSGNGNTGTLNGGMSATGWTTSIPSSISFTDPYALEFDGNNDYVEIGDVSYLDMTFLSFTASAWVKRNETGQLGYVMGKMGLPGNRGWQIYYWTDDKLYFDFFNGPSGSSDGIGSPGTYTASTWTHIAATFNANTGSRLYVNGVSVASDSSPLSVLNGSNAIPFRVGDRGDGDGYLNALIDDVRIYNRALTPAEVATLAAGNYASHSTVINDATTVSNSFINPAGLNLDVSSYTLTASNSFTNLGSITESTGYVIHDATLDVSDASIPGTIGFTLTDSDENTDSSTRETFTLAAQSENVTMTETTVNSGIFTGSLTTACGEETPNNGIVERQGSATYSFFATFTDPQDSTDVMEDSSTLTQTTCSVSTAPTAGGGGGGGGGGSKSPTLPFTAAKITTAQSSSSSPNPLPAEAAAKAGGCSPLNTFSDVPSCSWYSGYVLKTNNAGMVSGYANDDGTPKNLFGPADPVTYAQIAKMTLTLRKSLFGPLPAETSVKAGGPGPGNPSAKNTWSAPYIAEAEALGLSQYPNTQDVNTPMPRGAVIRTLLDILGISPDPDSIHNPFTDLPPSHPHYGAILTAYEMGLISGDTDANGAMTGTVRPDDTISRSEAVKLLSLLLDQQIALPHADGPAGAQQEQTPLLSPSPSTGIYRMTQPLLYLRSTPSPKAYIIIVLRRNELLKVLSHDSGSPWAKVERSDGREGYVYTTSLEYVSEDWPPHEVRYTSNSLTNLRGGAFIDAAVRATLPKGTKVTVLRHVDVWSQVQLDDGRTGYIATELLKMNNE